ncbi:hypothetical protein GCK72_005517 [Caenorhabditis remanei]|uniref:Uncharacterized protein n=1 Tax=Caenorhabditis remanei TaxID=31234 RepID=A0A6A5HDZ9_CAERE|nr:hypothetical protein GCK72_005517 [Caenorhabditis remanei]KAF1765565.1 hypothetical protein GCK72_005517 [Caenorhabditis remanei]
MLLSLVTISVFLIADIYLGKDLLSRDIDDSNGNISLMIVHMHWMPLLISELGSFWEWNPSVIKTTNRIRKMDKKLNGTNILAVLVIEPREVGSNLEQDLIYHLHSSSFLPFLPHSRHVP